MTHTYLFTDPQDHTGYLGSVIDALTGRETALFSDARGAVVVGEPLCMVTDQPADECQCEECLAAAKGEAK